MLAAAVIVAVTPMGLEPRQEIKAAVTSWTTGSSAAVGAQRWGLNAHVQRMLWLRAGSTAAQEGGEGKTWAGWIGFRPRKRELFCICF